MVAAAIFAAESALMALLERLPPLPAMAETLLDATLLVLLVYPPLHLLLFRPLVTSLTERERALDSLEHSRRRYRELAETVPGVVYQYHLDGARYVYLNDRAPTLFGLSEPRLRESGAYLAAVHPDDRERVEQTIAQAAAERHGIDLEHRLLRPDGEPIWVHNIASRYDGAADADTAWIGLLFDISERHRAEEELRRARDALYEKATRDPLTGVLNRGAIMERLLSERDRAVRHHTPLSVSLLDIDRFKAVNDTYGHLTGDDALRTVAARLALGCRAYDTLGRYGGEEFLVVLPGCDPQGALSQAERLRSGIADTSIATGSGELPITISVGVATLLPGPEICLDALLHAADEALYRAKAAGRNRVVAMTVGKEA